MERFIVSIAAMTIPGVWILVPTNFEWICKGNLGFPWNSRCYSNEDCYEKNIDQLHFNYIEIIKIWFFKQGDKKWKNDFNWWKRYLFPYKKVLRKEIKCFSFVAGSLIILIMKKFSWIKKQGVKKQDNVEADWWMILYLWAKRMKHIFNDSFK